MTDYLETIRNNLSYFPGIINHSDRVAFINDDLNMLNERFPALVRNFLTQTDPDRAHDFLFEIWICKMLIMASVEGLCYEPADVSIRPPDFRCCLNGVQFDIQIKRLHNISNEITKRIFQRECRRRLGRYDRSWFINLRISDELKPEHINRFFSYLSQNFLSFKAKTGYRGMLEANDYIWRDSNEPLVSFSFTEKNEKTGGISIGAIHSGSPGRSGLQWVNFAPCRKSMNRVLKKAKTTFSMATSFSQSNLVIVQPDAGLSDMDCADDMADVLYGDDQTVMYTSASGNEVQKDIRARNGILKDHCSITGVIFVPPSVFFMAPEFMGSYFLNEHCLKQISQHPKLFPKLTYYVLPEWKH